MVSRNPSEVYLGQVKVKENTLNYEKARYKDVLVTERSRKMWYILGKVKEKFS